MLLLIRLTKTVHYSDIRRNNDLERISKKTSVGHVLIHIFMMLLSLLCIYSFLIVLGSSFESQKEIMTRGYSAIPLKFDFTAYKMLFRNSVVLDSYKITILVTVCGTLAGVFISALLGYVMSRKDYAYRNILAFYVFFTMLFSGGLVPSYILISKWLNLKNTIFALILPSVISAWNVMLMKNFFKSVPDTLIEAAKIDGMGEFGIFLKIVIPLSKPALATIALFYALGYWNQWYNSMIYTDTANLSMLQYTLLKLTRDIEYLNSAEAMQYGAVTSGTEIPTYGMRMAMCVVAAGPMVLIFPFFQKYFVKGITIGSVKG